MTSVEERLEKVEAQVRRWRLMAFAFVVLSAVVLLLGAVPENPKQLAVERLVITDGSGKARIELKCEERDNQKNCGLFFLDDQGQSLGSLAVPVNTLILSLEESAQIRRATNLSVLAGMDRSLPEEKKKELKWESTLKEALERANKAGPLRTSVSARGLTFSDMTEGAFSFSQVQADGLSTPRIAVRKSVAVTQNEPGTIDIEDGALIVRESASKHLAVLGRTKLVNPKTGAETDLKAASLTLFDSEGKVSFRAP